MFKKLDHVLPDRLSRLKVRRPADTEKICRAADEALGELWHHAVPMRATAYRAGRVTVAVISPAWGTEVATRADKVIKVTNRKLKKVTVKTIRTVVDTDRAAGSGD